MSWEPSFLLCCFICLFVHLSLHTLSHVYCQCHMETHGDTVRTHCCLVRLVYHSGHFVCPYVCPSVHSKVCLLVQSNAKRVLRCNRFFFLAMDDSFLQFLFACYATLHPALLVRRSVRPSHFTFSASLGFLAMLLLPNAPLTSIIPPAHPHATRVAVYTALFYASSHLFSRFFSLVVWSVGHANFLFA